MSPRLKSLSTMVVTLLAVGVAAALLILQFGAAKKEDAAKTTTPWRPQKANAG